jgi:hypothetical protein
MAKRFVEEAPGRGEDLCARCGRLRDAGEAPCARCALPPVRLRWLGGPARDNALDAAFRAGLGGVVWPAIGGSAVGAVAAAVAGVAPAALLLAVPVGLAAARPRKVHGFVVDQLAMAFGRFWFFVSVDGSGRGALLTLRGERVAGFGSWLDLVEQSAVEPDVPGADEVVAAGPQAVARALADAPWLPGGLRVDGVHVLLLAAVARAVARDAVRTWRAERWKWTQRAAAPLELVTGSAAPPQLAWARGHGAAAPAGSLEAALEAAIAEQAAIRGRGALVGAAPGVLPGGLGAPYRGGGPGGASLPDTPPPAEPLKLSTAAIGEWLMRHRPAPASPDAGAVAARLRAVGEADPFFAAHVVAEAENVRIAWFEG